MDQHTLDRFAIALGIAKNASTDGGRRQSRQLAANVASQAGLTFDAAFALLDEEDRIALAGVAGRAVSIAADDDQAAPAPYRAGDGGTLHADDEDEDDAEDGDEHELLKSSHFPSSANHADEPDQAASHPSTTAEIERVAAVKAALAADPDRSDRDVAREIGCSPTTVGRARTATGLQRLVRKVTRGDSSYTMASRPAEPGDMA